MAAGIADCVSEFGGWLDNCELSKRAGLTMSWSVKAGRHSGLAKLKERLEKTEKEANRFANNKIHNSGKEECSF